MDEAESTIILEDHINSANNSFVVQMKISEANEKTWRERDIPRCPILLLKAVKKI